MPYTSTLTLHNERFRQLQRTRNTQLAIVESANTTFAEFNRNIRAMERVIDEAKALHENLQISLSSEFGITGRNILSSDYTPSALSYVESSLIDAPNNGLTRLRNALLQAEDTQRGASSRLATANEALSGYPEGYTGETEVTKAEVVAQLRNLPNINRRSIGIGQFSDGPMLRYIMEDVICKVDHPLDEWSWINCKPGQTPAIFLQDVVVRANLNSGSVKLSPKRGERALAPFNWAGQNRLHPHVLDADHPCLGDFGGTLREAIANRDWGTYGGVMKLFLETAITDDAAGANWKNGLQAAVNRALREVFPGVNFAYSMNAPANYDTGRCEDYTNLRVQTHYLVPSESYAMRLYQITPGVYELIINDEHIGMFSTHPQDTTFLYAFEYDGTSPVEQTDEYRLAA